MNSHPPDRERPPDDRPLLITPDMLAVAEGPDGRIDFERGMSRAPLLSLLLIIICATVFVFQLASGALDDGDKLIAAGALVRDRVLAGEYPRLFSAVFLHASFGHLASNCLVLYIVGMACEHAFGFVRVMIIYFLSALGGAMLSMAFHPGPSVGASGAIFGVTGATITFFYRFHRAVYLRDRRLGFVLLIWALYQIGTGFLDPFIDNFAHIGGLLTGVVAGLILRPKLLAATNAS
jgi:rhomboid protease GluP